MTTITDAVKKRKKEAGGEEAEELVPVDLDEPDVEVPKERRIWRIVALAAVVLLVGGAAVSAFIFLKGIFGGAPASRRTSEPSKVASLSRPGRQEGPSGKMSGEALPLPAAVSPTPGRGTGAPQLTSPVTAETTSPPREAIAAGAAMPPARESSASPSAESPPVVPARPAPDAAAPGTAAIPSEPPAGPQADPFASVKLQGIIRFDPSAPEVLINGKSLRVGDSFDGIQVVEIGADSVKLRYRNVVKTIRYW